MKKYTLKELREKNNMTQKDVAEELKVNKNYISMLENGTRNPSDKMKNHLAKLYKCSVVDIFLSIQTTKCSTKEAK
ncbi:MAG: helix-turn-helix transcriptional regulator [Clostridia bacterium]